MEFQANAAPILVIFGQSNAHGHGTRLDREEEIREPLTNVFGLDRVFNQAYDLPDVVWSGFRTDGMNLGETQDHTYCLAEGFARLWQHRTDTGELLPPLYIIQISIGAMGIAQKERDGLNMWWPKRAPVMNPGALDDINISLYPLAVQILTLAVKNLRSAGKVPCFLGLHWNQWETEADTGGDSICYAKENYTELFAGLRKAVQSACPIWLYRPLSDVYCNPEGTAALTELFEELVRSGEDYRLMDLSTSVLWNPQRQDKGIFQEDLVHYTPEAQRYFADRQAGEIFGGLER